MSFIIFVRCLSANNFRNTFKLCTQTPITGVIIYRSASKENRRG